MSPLTPYITSPSHMPSFTSSHAHSSLLLFVRCVGESIIDHPFKLQCSHVDVAGDDDCVGVTRRNRASDYIALGMSALTKLASRIDTVKDNNRFGNLAFREWLGVVEGRVDGWVKGLLGVIQGWQVEGCFFDSDLDADEFYGKVFFLFFLCFFFFF